MDATGNTDGDGDSIRIMQGMSYQNWGIKKLGYFSQSTKVWDIHLMLKNSHTAFPREVIAIADNG